jgi:hypothetical protein
MAGPDSPSDGGTIRYVCGRWAAEVGLVGLVTDNFPAVEAVATWLLWAGEFSQIVYKV